MDPIGFAFEHYDAAGRWRDIDGGKPVDATGDADRHRRRRRARRRAQPRRAPGRAATRSRACAATQWFRYAFGRAEQIAGRPVHGRQALAGAFTGANGSGDFKKMVRADRAHGDLPQPAPRRRTMKRRLLAANDPARRRPARPSACPGWRRWRRAARRPRPAPVKRFVVMFSANGTIPSAWTPTARPTSARPTSRCRRSSRRSQPHQADIVVVSGLEPAGRRRRRPPERHRRHAHRQPAQRRSVRRRRRAAGRLGDGPVGRPAHRRRARRRRPSCARSSSACRSAPPTTGGA